MVLIIYFVCKWVDANERYLAFKRVISKTFLSLEEFSSLFFSERLMSRSINYQEREKVVKMFLMSIVIRRCYRYLSRWSRLVKVPSGGSVGFLVTSSSLLNPGLSCLPIWLVEWHYRLQRSSSQPLVQPVMPLWAIYSQFGYFKCYRAIGL